MRLLFDENLAEALLPALLPSFPESNHVRRLGAGGATDDSIWVMARDGGFALVNRDDDFQRLSALYGAPPKVIWIALHNCSNADVVSLLLRSVDRIRTFLDDDELAFLALGKGRSA